MIIDGLSSEFYLINNPISVTVIDSQLYSYIFYNVKDLTTQTVSKSQRLYFFGNTLSFDISKLIKSQFPEPNHLDLITPDPFNDTYQMTSYRRFKLTITGTRASGFSSANDTVSISKTYIRGGKRGYVSNQNLSAGDNLIVSDKVPVWGGFPSSLNFIHPIYKTVNRTLIFDNIENLKVKGCEPIYIKFLNSVGGYQYWLFENWEDNQGNKNLGNIERTTGVLDLGNTYENELTLISKIPKRYYSIIKDLIISPEIYRYDNGEWIRISSKNNKFKDNPFDVNTKVKLKFEAFNRLNPSLLW